MGFALQGFLLAPIGPPLGEPCPPGVAHVSIARSPVERTDAAVFRASIPASSSFRPRALASPRADAFLGFIPSEHSPLPSSRTLLSTCGPPPRVGRDDVPVRLRLGVLRSERVGWPLSGLPALLGFTTLRPSRHRCGCGWGRAHDFASRPARLQSREPLQAPSHAARPEQAPARRRRPSVNGYCLFLSSAPV